MKAIQVMFEEGLLARLDADDQVRREGRSAVLRRAAAEYLERRRLAAIEARYRSAYGDPRSISDELSGWEEEGQWPN